MQTSALGRAFIERFESLVLVAYRDQVNLWSIGWGHRITEPAWLAVLPTDITVRRSSAVTITKERADTIMSNDLRVAESAVNSCVKVKLEQHEFDALVSFTFNCGTGAFIGSTLLKLLNAGDRQGAADEFCKWDHGTVNGVKVVIQGLLARRNDDTTLFLGTDGPTTDPGMKRPSQV